VASWAVSVCFLKICKLVNMQPRESLSKLMFDYLYFSIATSDEAGIFSEMDLTYL
jgi:hypothetical protein